MISYSNSDDYDKRSKRKQVRRKRAFHRAACITLCLFMAATVFGAVSLISAGKEASPSGKRSAGNTGEYSQMDGRQSEKGSADANQANLISADIRAENAIVINTGANTVLYQKNSTDEIAPASTEMCIRDRYKADISCYAGSMQPLVCEDIQKTLSELKKG